MQQFGPNGEKTWDIGKKAAPRQAVTTSNRAAIRCNPLRYARRAASKVTLLTSMIAVDNHNVRGNVTGSQKGGVRERQ